jgi:filamentous hemagglutinin family protein
MIPQKTSETFTLKAFKSIIAIALAIFTFLSKSNAQNLPTGAQVIHGDITLQTNSTSLHLHQTTQRAILNFDTFDINAGYGVHFHLPSSDAATLARVTGPAASFINGDLTSTGSLYLINPNGLLVGKDARILTRGDFAASTLDIANSHFLSSSPSNLHFIGDPQSTAWIQNHGHIQAGGNLYLIGTQIRNTGSITATQGTAHIIAGGQEIVIQDAANPKSPRAFIRSKIDPTEDHSQSTAILNTGTIQAAAIEIQAAGGIYGTAINLGDTSTLLAHGSTHIPAAIAVTSTQGDIEVRGALRAHNLDGSGGTIHIDSGETILPARPVHTTVAAHISTSALEEYNHIPTYTAPPRAGTVTILGQHIALTDSARIEANATHAPAGRILVGGDYQGKNSAIRNAHTVTINPLATLSADALQSGDGGTIIIWSDRATQMNGTLLARAGQNSGDGGFIEISSAGYLGLADDLNVSVAAPKGKAGTILFDPSDITISNNPNSSITGSPDFSPTASPSNISYNTLNALLSQGNSVTISTSGSGNGNGDITFIADPFSKGGVLNFSGNNTTLTLNADRHITIDPDVVVSIKGSPDAGQRLILNANTTSGTFNILGNLTLDAAMNGLEAQAASIQFGPKGVLLAGAGDIVLTAHQGDITLAPGSALNVTPSNNPSTETNLRIQALKGNLTMQKDTASNRTSSLIIDASTARIQAEKNITLADAQIRLQGTEDAEITAKTGSIQLNDLFVASLDDQNLVLTAAQNITQAQGADIYLSSKQNRDSFLVLQADPSEQAQGNITLNGNFYGSPGAPLNASIFASGNIAINGSINTGPAREFIINSTKGNVTMTPTSALSTATTDLVIRALNNVTLHNLELTNLENASDIIAENGNLTLGSYNAIQIKNAPLNLTAGKDIQFTDKSETHITSTSASTGSLNLQAGQAITMGNTSTLKAILPGPISLQAHDDIKLASATLETTGNNDITLRSTDGSILDNSTAESPNLSWKTQPQNKLHLQAAQSIGTPASDLNLRALDDNQAIRLQAGQGIHATETNSNTDTLHIRGATTTAGDINLTAQTIRDLTLSDTIATQAPNSKITLKNTTPDGAIHQNATIGTADSPTDIRIVASQEIKQAPNTTIQAAGGTVTLETTNPYTHGDITGATGPYRALKIDNASRITAKVAPPAPNPPASNPPASTRSTTGAIRIAHDTTATNTLIEELNGHDITLTHRGPAQSNLTVNKVTPSNRDNSSLMILAGRHGKENTPDNLIENDLTIAGNIQGTNKHFDHILLAANRNVTIGSGATVQAHTGGTIRIISDESNPTTIGNGRITNNGTLNAGPTGHVLLYSNRRADTIPGTIIAANSADAIGNRFYQTDHGDNAYTVTSPLPTDLPQGQTPGADFYKDTATDDSGSGGGGGTGPGGGSDDGGGTGPGGDSGGGGTGGGGTGGGTGPGGGSDDGGGTGGGSGGGGTGGGGTGGGTGPGGGSGSPGLGSGFSPLPDGKTPFDFINPVTITNALTEALYWFSEEERSKVAQKGAYGPPWDFVMAEIFIPLNLASESIPDTLRMWRNRARTRTFVGEKRPNRINVEGLPDATVFGVYSGEYWGRYTVQERIEMIRDETVKKREAAREKRRRESNRGGAAASGAANRLPTVLNAPPSQRPLSGANPSVPPPSSAAAQGRPLDIDPAFFRPTIVPPDAIRPRIEDQREIRRNAIPAEDGIIYRIPIPR